ncbi:AraC family transcriptional regulator [Mycobacterium sp. URHB0044]|uniref:AraC family transcriptional regulator n=1 Tax=Mycobacterium sp. URHB0044 TaxID=1380386 RepID=UPI00049039E9|nr:AraC family transcriptional regulator [Mycobacterium sp. URHB0044]
MADVVRAAALNGYEALMHELGVAPWPVLERNDIDPDLLHDAESMISLSATGLLLEDSAAATQCPDFGLRLAGRQETGDLLGPLAIALLNAPTVEQALIDASRYLFFHSPAYEFTLDEHSSLIEGCATIYFAIRQPGFVQQRQLLEGCLGYTVVLSRLVTGGQFGLRSVSLPHTPVATKAVYRRFFGAPVHFEQPYAGLHVDREVLQLDLKAANPMLRQLAIEYIGQRCPPRVHTMADQVRQALTRSIGAGTSKKKDIAALLRMHPRTLQRRLEDEGETFEAIREDVYKNATLHFLRETDIPLKQLAGALDFSEQSALTRSCTRWFGTTPSRIRRGTGHPDASLGPRN